MVRRWQQLPLDHALGCMPRVRLLLEQLAGRAVPDLGPGAVMDQLTVLVYDTCAASGSGEPSTRHTELGHLEQRLADLRRSLHGSTW